MDKLKHRLNFDRKHKVQRILVVEDDPSWQQFVSHCLKLFGGKTLIKTRFVRSGREALNALYYDGPYDLVISDHYLNGPIQGLDLWKKCRKSYNSIPFIMVSGMSRRDLVSALNEEGTYPFLLRKPYNPHDLISILDIYLGDQRTMAG